MAVYFTFNCSNLCSNIAFFLGKNETRPPAIDLSHQPSIIGMNRKIHTLSACLSVSLCLSLTLSLSPLLSPPSPSPSPSPSLCIHLYTLYICVCLACGYVYEYGCVNGYCHTYMKYKDSTLTLRLFKVKPVSITNQILS